MLEWKHVKAFAASNGLSALSIAPSLALVHFVKKPSFASWYVVTLFRLVVIASVLDYLTKHRRMMNKDVEKSTLSSSNILHLLLVSVPLETFMAQQGVKHFTTSSPSSLTSWLWFIPHTFFLEIIFDFGHYWSHRFMHANALVYKLSGHKTHHFILHPSPFSTFQQEPVDAILSNVLPFFVALRVVGSKLTVTQFLLFLGLKTYVEVAGHVGVLDGRATSFPQCVWLPRLLGIALHTKDHDLHHTHGGRHNFAKRFTLFDRMFSTYHSL